MLYNDVHKTVLNIYVSDSRHPCPVISHYCDEIIGKWILLLTEEGGEIFLCLGRQLRLGRPSN
jgi:hypothetical protein